MSNPSTLVSSTQYHMTQDTHYSFSKQCGLERRAKKSENVVLQEPGLGWEENHRLPHVGNQPPFRALSLQTILARILPLCATTVLSLVLRKEHHLSNNPEQWLVRRLASWM